LEEGLRQQEQQEIEEQQQQEQQRRQELDNDDANFLRQATEEGRERVKEFNAHLGKGEERQTMPILEPVLNNLYVSANDLENNERADQFIAQIGDREFIPKNEKNIDCLLLRPPQLLGEFEEELTAARGKFSDKRFTRVNNAG
jgi:hypothetical protein